MLTAPAAFAAGMLIGLLLGRLIRPAEGDPPSGGLRRALRVRPDRSVIIGLIVLALATASAGYTVHQFDRQSELLAEQQRQLDTAAARARCETAYVSGFREAVERRDRERVTALSRVKNTAGGDGEQAFVAYLAVLERILREYPLPASECDR